MPTLSPESSPTGAPVIAPGAVPWILTLVGLAEVMPEIIPGEPIVSKISKVVLALATVLGIASPGLRRKDGA